VSQAEMFDADGWWRQVSRRDVRARRLADRHYSRQSIGAADFMGNGRTFVLLRRDDGAVWGAIENHDPVPPAKVHDFRRGDYKPQLRWRVSIFRRETGPLASDLIREATEATYCRWFRASWRERFGTIAVPLTTEIDPTRTRRKRDPGRCFLRAGWTVLDPDRRGLVVLVASEADAAWRRA
jgi:hypothetical protein